MNWHRARWWASLATLSILAAACGGAESPEPGEAGFPGEGGDADPAETQEPLVSLQKPEDPDRVLATVNGTGITAGRVYQLAYANKIQMIASGQEVPDEGDRTLLVGALGVLIDGELMIQDARAAGVSVSEDQLEAEMAASRAPFGSEEEFQQSLERLGVTEDEVRAEAERRILMRLYQDQLAASEPVGDDALRDYYDENRSRFVTEEQVHAAQILIRSSRQDVEARREEARTRMQEVQALATQDQDFGELAREYSQGPAAPKGGDLGFFGRGIMVPTFEQAAFSTPAGEISDIVESPYGFHLIKVIERREPVPLEFEAVKPQLAIELVRQRRQEMLVDKLAELRAAADVKVEFELDEQAEEPAG